MMSWKDIIVKQREYQDLVREAEDGALVRQALMERKRRAPLVWRLLTALVPHLVKVGCYLLEHGASVLKVPVQTPCQDVTTNENL